MGITPECESDNEVKMVNNISAKSERSMLRPQNFSVRMKKKKKGIKYVMKYCLYLKLVIKSLKAKTNLK
jgi:hypothetical protein